MPDEISQQTVHIKTAYPELYQFLGGILLTIPSTKHLAMDYHALEDYLESLKQLPNTIEKFMGTSLTLMINTSSGKLKTA